MEAIIEKRGPSIVTNAGDRACRDRGGLLSGCTLA